MIILIKGYKIKKENNKEVLYIELEFNYEFAKFSKTDKKDIKKEIKDFLTKNNIVFKGMIVLTSLGFVIGRIDSKSLDSNKTYFNKNILENVSEIYISDDDNMLLSLDEDKEENKENNTVKLESEKERVDELLKENEEKEEVSSLLQEEKRETVNVNTVKNENEKGENVNNDNYDTKTSNEDDNHNEVEEKKNEIYVTVNGKDGLFKIELEEYVVGVVAVEMPASFNVEYLKAMSLLERTYALKSIKYGRTLTTDERTQTFKTVDEMKKMWGDSFDKYYNKIKEATQSTKGEYLWYENDYIEALYHSMSNGKTEDSIEVWGNFYPYLVSVDSIYDDINKSFNYEKVMSYSCVSSILKMEVNVDTDFNVISYTNSGRVKEIKINDKTFKGTDIRNLLSLRSTDFSFEKNSDGLVIKTKGYGHGVGLSEWGAEGLARNGYNYKEIINHYYKNIEIKKL